ncbi:MAG: ABC-F family ATP-binding cassette domain-containing protein [Bacteroidales bacterium]
MTPLLQADNISKSYGSLSIFSGISLVINKDEKVALVARNGEGKTTLLNVLSGKDTADSGEVTAMRDLKIGYLEQDPVLDDRLNVIDQVFASSGEITSTIREYEDAIKSGDQNLIDNLTSRMDALQAWDQETKAKQILTELDITEFEKPVGQLSGGQRKRVALAKVLIDQPELLILDEPTNHLDLDMSEWLENYLKRVNLTILMVTHDRYFLDRVCNQIIELDNNNIYKYSGNYSYFVEKRVERLENIQAVTDKARNLLRKELDWMRRMPKARTSKSKSRIDAFYELKDKAAGTQDAGNIKIRAGSRRLGNKVLELRHISKSYDGETVIRDFSYTFSRFEKAGIIGKNGTGKSTFLNIVTGSLSPDSGTIDKGETVRFGYFRQEGISFDDGQRVIDAVRDIAEVVTMGDGSTLSSAQLLNHFLFPPPRQHDYIGKLSGGERRRLYLVTVLMRNPNFLILDEPTNDLDIETLNVLEDYLVAAGICLLVVSHDRFFLDKISDHIFVFEGNGVIRDFPGNYTQFRSYLQEEARKQSREEKTVPGPAGSGKKQSSQPPARKIQEKVSESGKKKKLGFKEKRELEQLEKDIELLEQEKETLEEALSGGTLTADQLQEYSLKHAEISNRLDTISDRWLELSELE